MKILLAEDNMRLQKSVCMILDCFDIDYDTADNGQEAVDHVAANEGEYDLCLMDLEMPIMDGYKATLILRRDYKYFPIVALSGFSEHIVEGIHAVAGMDDWITKPCHPERLLDKINELTVKTLKINRDENHFNIKKETPMDAEELKELRELAKRDLALLIVEDGKQRFVVHKNIQKKMSSALIGEGKELFEFLDRGDAPANCHLYKANMQTNRLLLTPEQFDERLKAENENIESFSTTVDQNFTDGKKD